VETVDNFLNPEFSHSYKDLTCGKLGAKLVENLWTKFVVDLFHSFSTAFPQEACGKLDRLLGLLWKT
jgi:hypothetical protein